MSKCKLVQREEDFIVDTLALRDELEDMNEVFTDPKITKVFHGAESDIIWLQQDSLYTLSTCLTLSMPRKYSVLPIIYQTTA